MLPGVRRYPLEFGTTISVTMTTASSLIGWHGSDCYFVYSCIFQKTSLRDDDDDSDNDVDILTLNSTYQVVARSRCPRMASARRETVRFSTVLVAAVLTIRTVSRQQSSRALVLCQIHGPLCFTMMPAPSVVHVLILSFK